MSKNNKYKRGMISTFFLLLFLGGCAAGKQEEFVSVDANYADFVEIQEAYAPIVKSERLEAEEQTYQGVGSIPKTASVSVTEQAAVSENAIVSEKTSNNEIESFEGVTDIALHKVTYGDTQMYQLGDSDYLIAEPKRENGNSKKAVEATAKKLSALQKKYPDIPFYSYYINRATDNNWYSQNQIAVFSYADYFEKQLGKNSSIQAGQYQLDDVGAYMKTGYKTDFHVNNRGSYEVYQDIYKMLAKDLNLSDMLVPSGEDDYDTLLFTGLPNAAGLEFMPEQMDVFRTYRFDFGAYDSYVGNKKTTIGLEKEYQSGKIVRDVDFDHQFSYYGGQSDTVRFDFHQPDKPNLLLISDSQGRPSRKLLAAHFNQTIFLDDIQYRTANLEQVIEENEITAIIFMGQSSMFEWYRNE